jgi:hypothetical protein
VLDTGLGYFFLTRSRFGAWSDSSWQYRSKAKPRVKRGATKEGMSEIEQPALKRRQSAPPNKPAAATTHNIDIFRTLWQQKFFSKTRGLTVHRSLFEIAAPYFQDGAAATKNTAASKILNFTRRARTPALCSSCTKGCDSAAPTGV